MNTPYVATLTPLQTEKLFAALKTQDFELSRPEHTQFQARKKGVTCTVYSSGKVVVQGKDSAEFIQFFLEPQVLESFKYGYEELSLNLTPRIGIDESGKGDFFGPLCVAGVFAGGAGVKRLQELGVKDSKKLSDPQIAKIAEAIQKEFPHEIIRISPLKYNALYPKFSNLNTFLAWGHATAIEDLNKRTGCNHVVIDQFASEHVVINALKKKRIELDLHQRHRAEEDLVVAAASILARHAFVQGLKKLSEQYQIELPKGASKAVIEAGIEFIRKYGPDAISQVAKTHFKTLDAILEKKA